MPGEPQTRTGEGRQRGTATSVCDPVTTEAEVLPTTEGDELESGHESSPSPSSRSQACKFGAATGSGVPEDGFGDFQVPFRLGMKAVPLCLR